MNRIESNDMELTRQKWVNEGGIYFPISGDTVLLRRYCATEDTRKGRVQRSEIAKPDGRTTWLAENR